MYRATRLALAAVVYLATAAAARAQSSVPALTLVPRNRTLVVDAGRTATTVFAVANLLPVPMTVVPRIREPAEWAIVMGSLPFGLAAHEADTWIVSISVPMHTPAGVYTVPVEAIVDGAVAAEDSLVIRVTERHALAVALVDAPPYVVAGQSYRSTFLVRNRGNGIARVRISARTGRGTLPLLNVLSVTLGADSSRTIRVLVPTAVVGARTVDDMVEVRAAEVADSSSHAAASVRVTIVPKPGRAEELVTVPAQLLLRASGGSGVAPFDLHGEGPLDPGGATQVEFVARGPTARSSPFAEREEYRLAVRAPDYRVRLGDDLYGYTALASSGQMGVGAGGEVARGALVGGAYAERFRVDRASEGESESGALLAIRPGGLSGTSQLAVNALDRVGGALAGQVLGAKLRLQSMPAIGVDADVATSRGPSGVGSAAQLRLSGSGPLQYDVGHTAATLGFAGASRGSTHDYAIANAPLTADLQVTAAASSHETNTLLSPFDSTGVPVASRLRTASLGLTHSSGLALSYAVAARRDIVPTVGLDGSQQGLTARAQRSIGAARLWGSTELGTMHDVLSRRDHPFHDVELGGAVDVGANTVSLYGQVYDGPSVMRGPLPMRVLGGSANLHLTSTTSFSVFGSGSTTRTAAGAFALIDARLSQALHNGATLSLRARLASGRASLLDGGRVVYLEYGLPLRVPVGPLRTPGRVKGRIVNGETGRGVEGTLVRLGNQAAITDADGRVSFSGLPAGEYRVSLAQNVSLASSAIDGDAKVVIDSGRREPATFRLAVARAAIVQGTIRRMIVAKTGVGGQADSIVDAGPMSDAVVALTSGRDTLYRVTDDSGFYRFVELPARQWTLTVLSAPPANSKFEPASVALVLVPGQTARVDFRARPRHREVHIIDSDDTPLVLPPPGRGTAGNRGGTVIQRP